MNQLKSLSKVLKNIEKLSTSIKAETLKIMKSIQTTENNDLFEELQEKAEAEGIKVTDKQTLLNFAQDISLTYLADAEKISDELDFFIVSSEDNSKISVTMEGCPFLSTVWNGDLYDKSEIEGLRELERDLRHQLENITEEKFVDFTVDQLRKTQ